jgi:hypothetical protein
MSETAFGPQDNAIEIGMLRGMVDELTQQVSDLSRFLIATVQTVGGNVEIPTQVIECLDAKDAINVEPVLENDSIRLWVSRAD